MTIYYIISQQLPSSSFTPISHFSLLHLNLKHIYNLNHIMYQIKSVLSLLPNTSAILQRNIFGNRVFRNFFSWKAWIYYKIKYIFVTYVSNSHNFLFHRNSATRLFTNQIAYTVLYNRTKVSLWCKWIIWKWKYVKTAMDLEWTTVRVNDV